MRLLWPLTLADFGSLEMRLLDQCSSRVESVVEQAGDMDEDCLLMLVEIAQEEDKHRPHFVASEDLSEFLDTIEGLSLAMWICFRDSALDYQTVKFELWQASPETFRSFGKSLRLVSCLDESAQKDWMVASRDESVGPARTNWKYLVRQLCVSEFGAMITPQQIGQLTLYNLWMLCRSEGNVKGMRMSLGEFRAAQKSGKLDKANIRWLSRKKGA
jgi:hypothetical protein